MKNGLSDEILPVDDECFDRLVDGGLAAEEYRALLAALEDEPGGWRKCALAFLEAQALAQELSSLCVKPQPAAAAPGAKPPALFWTTSALLWAMAASFLVALTLGIVAPQFFRPGAKEMVVAGNLDAPQPVAAAREPAVAGRHEVMRPVGNLKLVMEGGEGSSTAGQVPVYEVNTGLEAVLAGHEAALGPELIDLFRDYGFEVRHEQQYLPAAMEDGRQVIVPLHGYEIRPVSRTY